MPTSHNMIIFTLATAGIASVSVLGLILAGLVPAIILTVCNMAAAYYVAVKRGYPTHGHFPGWAMVLSAFLAALPGLLVVEQQSSLAAEQSGSDGGRAIAKRRC